MKFSNGFCKICKIDEIENLEHLIYNCNNSKCIWRNIEDIIFQWRRERSQLGVKESIAGLWDLHTDKISDNILLINTLLSITRYHIWKIRCSVKYGDEDTNYTKSTRILKHSLVQHMTLLMSSSTTDANHKLLIDDLLQVINNYIFT